MKGGPVLDYPRLIKIILESYRLPLDGVHGTAHWARVFENGERLAEETGARLTVVQLFAVFHDSRRRNEAYDPGHGRRAADFARSLLGEVFELGAEEFDLLYRACVGHTNGRTKEDITVQTCWDSDRLDLGRVGIKPVPGRLCTAAARKPEVIRWAFERSIAGYVSERVLLAWDLAGMDSSNC
ncbi:MAG: hypothetical protein JXA25_07260 [Anaerolineales bacterium]|nr:hypothetical protein [Anaerolineales bacterium]